MRFRHVVIAALAAALAAMLIVTPMPRTRAQGDNLPLVDCTLDIGFGEATRTIPALCGTLNVPEDRAAPDGRQIELHVVVLPATSPDSTGLPIFHFEGGPGGSAITGYSRVWFSSYEMLRANHDIVLLDQRGTGRSGALTCTEFGGSALQTLASAPNPEEELAETVSQMQACLERLSATTDPADYTSAALADDTNAVREALGYEQINLFGSSYGTWLAQIYLARHGDTVAGAVLEGVAGPWNSTFLGSGRGAQAAMEYVFALCAADPACDSVYPDLPGQLQRALERVEAEPAQTVGLGTLSGETHPVLITRGRLLDGLRVLLGDSINMTALPQAINQAAAGVYTFPASALVAYAEQIDDVSFGLYASIVCAEEIAFADQATIESYIDGSFFGRGDDSVEELVEICRTWRSAELDAADVAPVISDRPVLMFGGLFDAQTSIEFAREANRRLPNSTLVEFRYQGHGVMPFSGCAQQLAAAFFAAPEAPLDTACAAEEVRPAFAGTLQLRFEDFVDPVTGRTIPHPQGWQAETADLDGGRLLVFDSPAGQGLLQTMAVGLFQGVQVQVAAVQVEEALSRRLGELSLQASITSFGTEIRQYGLNVAGQSYTAVLVLVSAGQNPNMLFIAAPSSLFTATSTVIMFAVLPALLAM